MADLERKLALRSCAIFRGKSDSITQEKAVLGGKSGPITQGNGGVGLFSLQSVGFCSTNPCLFAGLAMRLPAHKAPLFYTLSGRQAICSKPQCMHAPHATFMHSGPAPCTNASHPARHGRISGNLLLKLFIFY